MKNPYEQDQQTYAILGAAMEVHKQLGPGFIEAVYQDALSIELNLRSVLFACEVPLQVFYKGRLLPHHFQADMVCYQEILVELKALANLTAREEAQILNYLKVSGLRRGLLINFGSKRLEYKRFVFGFDIAEEENHYGDLMGEEED